MVEIPRTKEKEQLKDGNHRGVILSVNLRANPYEYVDINIQEEETQQQITASFPKSNSKNSALGRCAERLGIKVEPSINTNDFNGKAVQFHTIQKPSKKDTNVRYAEVIKESIGLIQKPSSMTTTNEEYVYHSTG